MTEKKSRCTISIKPKLGKLNDVGIIGAIGRHTKDMYFVESSVFNMVLLRQNHPDIHETILHKVKVCHLVSNITQ